MCAAVQDLHPVITTPRSAGVEKTAKLAIYLKLSMNACIPARLQARVTTVVCVFRHRQVVIKLHPLNEPIYVHKIT